MKRIRGHDTLELLSQHIRRITAGRPIQILEAGCGQNWPVHLEGVEFTLTGVDLDPVALETRKAKDLDFAILGDLRNVQLPDAKYDVIYNAYVLEHIDGAESVIENFIRWLKPGGLLALGFPNPDSVYGYFTRISPMWIHVAFKRFVEGNRMAGKPGHAPYPTYYDAVLQRPKFLEFVRRKGLLVREERYYNEDPMLFKWFLKVVEILSLGKLSADRATFIYLLEKQQNQGSGLNVSSFSVA